MRASEFITEVQIDNQQGWGQVPYNQDVDYFGLRVAMRPSVFLKLALPLQEPVNPDIIQHIKSGGAIGAPFLTINIPAEWEDGDFTQPARVASHDGRNRMTTIQALEGDAPIEVHLFPKGGMRSRDLTPEIVKHLNAGMVPEWSQDRVMSGPLFSVETAVTEAPLADYVPMGNFEKPGPFRGADKRLIPHPTNQLKTQQFFEKTPYDFRLFFSNIPGTGRYSEYGPMKPEVLEQIFGEQAQQIIQGSEDAITIVFVGNKGDAKVMMTPWIMAHRIGHAIQAGERKGERNGTWRAAEQHFFKAINSLLADFYGKKAINQFPSSEFNTRQQAEYNALFNAIGTQRSSRKDEIRRPYEFMYELFAQYIGTGNITLKPLPKSQDYGRKAWGRSTQSMHLQPGAEAESQYTTEVLARDMELMFDDVLSSMVGKVLVM